MTLGNYIALYRAQKTTVGRYKIANHAACNLTAKESAIFKNIIRKIK